MHHRHTSAPCDLRTWRARISRFVYFVISAVTLTAGLNGPTFASDLELTEPKVTAQGEREPELEAASIHVAQRKTSLRDTAANVDFDLAQDGRHPIGYGLTRPTDGTEAEKSSVDVAFNSFSAAFTSALKNIREQDASQRPTPARDSSLPVRGSSPLGLLIDVVEEDVVKAAKGRLDLATEVKSSEERVVTSPLRVTPSFEAVAPSVSGPMKVNPRKGANKPLVVELDQYFHDLDETPNPTTANLPDAGVAIVDPVQPAETALDASVATPQAAQEAASAQVATPSKPVVATPVRQPPREPNVRITQHMAQLQPRIAKTLRFYFDRPLNTADDSAWSVMHSMLGYGPNGLVAINGERGQRTNVVHWLCQNGVCANRRLLYIQDGYIKGLEGPGFQGHPGQFLAMLAQIGVGRDFPMNIQGQRLTVDALVNSEMYTCSSQAELTFKLISLSFYLDSAATWKSENDETWSLPKILAIEMAQPVNGAACGGTHRIMSVSYAVRNRWLRGEPIDGVYAQAQQYVRQYQQYAMSLQNRDGSFSTEWFKRPATSKDKDRQLQTTGHILEWMVYSLPRNELSDPRIVKAVEFLTDLMTRNRYRDWEVGPRGHAIRALSLYHQRVFERQPSNPQMANAALWSSVRK